MPHSIRRRFVVSFSANMLRSGLSFVTGLLLARWLGPEDFGRMAFLLASFAAIRALTDMASSSAFFTFLSQRQRSNRFIRYYWSWVLFQFVVTLLLIAAVIPDRWVHAIWRGEGGTLLLFAFTAAFMQGTVWPIAAQMAEAQRETVAVQRLATMVVTVHLGVVLALWLVGRLVIPLLFGALVIEWGVAGWVAARMYRQGSLDRDSGPVPEDVPKSVLRQFWRYCRPYIPYALLGFIHDFSDRWMLQNWGGAAEQAYFAVAQQYASIALLATASILRIFWKEIAEAYHRGDMGQMERLYGKASRGLFFVGALTSGGLLPWASEIIQMSLGVKYAGGVVSLMLMFLYPVHQSMGQIGGSILLATEKTEIFVATGAAFMVISLVSAYLMMAPRDALIPGLNMGAEGLAAKMVVIQVISVNVQAWFITRTFGWRFDWAYQVIGLGLALSIGWLTRSFVTGVLNIAALPGMIVAGAAYLLVMSTIVLRYPAVAGLAHSDFWPFRKK